MAENYLEINTARRCGCNDILQPDSLSKTSLKRRLFLTQIPGDIPPTNSHSGTPLGSRDSNINQPGGVIEHPHTIFTRAHDFIKTMINDAIMFSLAYSH